MLNNGFEGWYFKQQANGRTLALIPGRSRDTAFIQVVTDDRVWHVGYPLSDYHKGNVVTIAGNRFTRDGIRLNIHGEGLNLAGELAYTNLTPLKSDIMGPFRFFPMECRHSVISMGHRVVGSLNLNGEPLNFKGRGYIEGDSGRSFPKSYTWVQCNAFGDDTSVMASIARVPFAGLHFTGCIAVVFYNGKEYRLATYRGVHIAESTANRIELRQGGLRLTVEVPEYHGHGLRAPDKGLMRRMIHETPSCPARFRFWHGGQLLFDRTSRYASFEYVP